VEQHPWRAGSATGIGSLPGTDIAEALKTVLGELPDLPHLPELPDRGPGAELIGRAAGLLVDLPVELYAARWKLAGHAGRDAQRTADLWQWDLDALTDHASDYQGPFKVQAAGPWTLAAGIDLPIGGAVLRDRGAVRDLNASLAEGLRAHVAAVAARLPGARLLLQLDEPSLPEVLAGARPTESGLGRLPAVAETDAAEALRTVVEAVAVPVVVHCCAPRPPVGLARSAGAIGFALDLDHVGDPEELGEALDAGFGLLAGAIPTTGQLPPSGTDAAERISTLWQRLGLPPGRLPEQVVTTPACGLAGATAGRARAALAACQEAGRRLREAG
jgi:methionine synthase II (cobalamin-independent)